MFVIARKYLFVALGTALALGVPLAIAQRGYPPLAKQVTLPQDEAPHHNSTEWWYFVGHLDGVDPDGQKRQYGFELTVFQERPTPLKLAPAIYAAHLAIADVTRSTYSYEERATLAHIPHEKDGFSFDIDHWTASGGSGKYALDAIFANAPYGLHLQLTSDKPAVLHGDKGIIPYGPFGTSAYYSYTSLTAKGTIVDHGVPVTVTGISWQDRQWGNYKSMHKTGWNWFCMQLNDNVQYMLYFIQDDTGNIVQKAGTKIVDGVGTAISADQMSMTPIDSWISSKSGNRYPSKWQVTVPDGSLTVTPLVPHQELVWPRQKTYFEGDSEISGTLNGKPASGLGYAEVNPYHEAKQHP